MNIEINEGINRYAHRQGLFVIKPSGERVAIPFRMRPAIKFRN